MESIAINGRNVNVQGIKELRDGLSVQEATTKTKKNGIDEVYFAVDGHNYLAFGDAIDIKELKQNKIASLTYNGRQGTVVAYEDEINSVAQGIKEGALNGLKKTRDALFGAVSNTITSVGPTSMVLAGGAIGLTALSLWKTGLATGTAGAITASASPLGNLLGDILKHGSIGALKVITVAGAIGFGLSAAAGAVGGVSEALSTEKDYSSIAAVTKDGNQGSSTPWSPNGPSTTPAPTSPTDANGNPTTRPGEIKIFSRPDLPMQFNSVSNFLSSRN